MSIYHEENIATEFTVNELQLESERPEFKSCLCCWGAGPSWKMVGSTHWWRLLVIDQKWMDLGNKETEQVPALILTPRAEGPGKGPNTQGGSSLPSWGKREPTPTPCFPYTVFLLHHMLPSLFLSHFISNASGNPLRFTFKIHSEYDHFSPPSLYHPGPC